MSDHYTIKIVHDGAWSEEKKGTVAILAEVLHRAIRAEYIAMDLRRALNALAEKTLDGGAAELPKSAHLDLEANSVREAIAFLRHSFPTAQFSEQREPGAADESAPRPKN